MRGQSNQSKLAYHKVRKPLIKAEKTQAQTRREEIVRAQMAFGLSRKDAEAVADELLQGTP